MKKQFGNSVNLYLFPLILLVLIASCKKEEDDEELPVVSMLSLNQAGDSLQLPAGNNLDISFSAADNRALHQYKIKISSAFYGFSQRNSLLSKTYVGNLSGSSENVTYSLPVADTFSSGTYEIEIIAIDKGGNESESIFGKLILTQSNQPVITVSNLSSTSTNVFNPSDTVIINGNIQDAADLEEVSVYCKQLSNETTVFNKTYSLNDTIITQWYFNEMQLAGHSLILPATPGETYQLILKVKNNSNNYTIRFFTLLAN